MVLATKVKVTQMSYFAVFNVSADICYMYRPQSIDLILVLTFTFDSRAIPGIQIISCHLLTSDKHYVKYEYTPSKNVRVVGITSHAI